MMKFLLMKVSYEKQRNELIKEVKDLTFKIYLSYFKEMDFF